jgi:hypothetical protein
LLSLLIGIPLIFLRSSAIVSAVWLFVPIAIYSFVGNFAPFFEVSIGVYLDGRKRIQWLVPLLIFMFPYNIAISTKAFGDFLVGKIMRRNHHSWARTKHGRNGYQYAASSAQKLVRTND